MYGSYSGIAGGNVAPSRFVKKTSSSGEPVISQAGAGEDTCGISGAATRKAAYTGWDDGYHAIAGENCLVHGAEDECLLEIAATITAGTRLKPDADGKGVAATTDKDRAGAVAQVGGVSGDLIRVKVQRFDVAA